jgi:hypothetical protein
MSKKPWKPTPRVTMSRRELLKAGAASLIATTGLSAKSAYARGVTDLLGVCPVSSQFGETLSLFGPDLGVVANDAMVKLQSTTQTAFLRSTGYSNGELQAEIVAMPPGMTGANVEVVLGMGAESNPINLPPEIVLYRPIYAWFGNGGNRYRSTLPIQLLEYTPRHCLNYWGYRSGGGISVEISLPFNESTCPNLPLGRRIVMRCCGNSINNDAEFAFEVDFVNRVPMSLPTLAQTLRHLINLTFEAEFGVTITSSQATLSENRVLLNIFGPDFSTLVTGAIQIDLLPYAINGDEFSFLNNSFSYSFGDIDFNDCNDPLPPTTMSASFMGPPDCSTTPFSFEPFVFA